MENSIENEYPAEATVGDQWQRGEAGKFEQGRSIFSHFPQPNCSNVFPN
jgi:hypothetical protein